MNYFTVDLLVLYTAVESVTTAALGALDDGVLVSMRVDADGRLTVVLRRGVGDFGVVNDLVDVRTLVVVGGCRVVVWVVVICVVVGGSVTINNDTNNNDLLINDTKC